MRRALLVYPEFPVNSYWNFRLAHERLLPRNRHGYAKGVIPPLGLLSIIGEVAERYGRENIRLIDMNVAPLSDADLAWADDVYLSAMLTQSESFDEVAARARAAGCTTIGGGPYVSEETPNLDFVFLGEAEHALVPFLDAFVGPDAVRGDMERVRQGSRPSPDAFLQPDFSWIDQNDYSSMGLQFSRGCPHDCEFCDITVRFGRAMRTKAVDAFLGEFDRLFDLGWRGPVFIIDDNFIGRPKDAAALLEALASWQKERGYPFELFTQATVLLADPRNEALLRAFYPAGFSMIFLGIETPNEASLLETKKKQNIRGEGTLAEKIQRIQEVGRLFVMGGFIVGFDNDETDIFDRQERFIVEETHLPVAMVGILEPLPYTKLEERLKEEGRLLRTSKGTVSGGSDVIFQPRHFTPAALEDGYLGLMRRLYTDTGEYYERCFKSIALAGPPLFNDAVSRDLLIAMGRLLYQEGVKSRYRGKFWRFLGRVIKSDPRKLPYAFRWAGYGLHYRVLTERMFGAREEALVAARAVQEPVATATLDRTGT